MTSIKRIFAAMAAGVMLMAAAPVQALNVGQRVSLNDAVVQLKKDNWTPLVVGQIPLPPNAPTAEEGTIEAEIKPSTPMLMIFSQKGTDKWSIGTRLGDDFTLQAEGNGLNLSAVEDQDTVAVSYKGPASGLKLVPVQQATGGQRCGPADKVDQSLRKSAHLARVIEGVEKDGKATMSFYAAYDRSSKWAVTRTTTDNVTCVMAGGSGYMLSPEREEFVPLWQKNIVKPS